MKPAMRTFHYGDSATQAGDLHLPEGDPRCVVCLLHGGFWKLPYGREQLTAVAQDLAARGHAAWNIGYRRVGEPGGGWPGALDDTVAAISHLARLSREGASLDLRHVVVAGHSAGGQLALLAGAAGACSTVVPLAAASLAGVVDLRRAHALGSGKRVGDDKQGAGKTGKHAGDDEGSQSVGLGVEAGIVHAGLVGFDSAQHHAERRREHFLGDEEGDQQHDGAEIEPLEPVEGVAEE